MVCKTCGGSVNRVGNFKICEFCGNKWEVDVADDIHAVDRANAWAALREGLFDKAAELFENIIAKESKNHEAYWGRALAHAGILYVTDINESKKVPTCNNITEESFLADKDVQKAISLAPTDIAKSYQQQAEYIEKVRLEWLEKASKEPAYDVFISFKDSDRENGIERTQDSIDAQDLYNALVAEGYKVFFSRISLRDKISEQYEPYIYNAIKTAKVMIVFGEKAEYFNAVWVKNEWSRFRTRIEKGEKHKNSLVVVYKNINPGDLPSALKARQCMNAADMTFLSDLNRHINRVIKETQNTARLERIEIVGGQKAIKASKIQNKKSIGTRTLAEGTPMEMSISESQSLSLAKRYLEHSDYEKALQLSSDILFDNPGNSEAVVVEFYARHKMNSDKQISELVKFDDYAGLHKVLGVADKAKSEAILRAIYQMRNMSSVDYAAMLNQILPYVFSGRNECIETLFDYSIENGNREVFEELVTTIGEDEVDRYLNKLNAFAKVLAKEKNSSAYDYIRRILECDASNKKAMDLRLRLDIDTAKTSDVMIAHIQEMLQYASNVDKTLLDILSVVTAVAATKELEKTCTQILKFYSGALATIRDQLLNIATWLIKGRLFQEAEYYLRLVLNFNQKDPAVYKLLCLIKAQVESWEALPRARCFLSEIPEFDKYMSMCSDEEQEELFKIQKKNRLYFQMKKHQVLSMHRTISEDGNLCIAQDGSIINLATTILDECREIYNIACTWRNVVSIHGSSASKSYTCLHSDGTVSTTLENAKRAVENWRNIVAIALRNKIIYGLKSDGTVCVSDSSKAKEVSQWQNIVSLVERYCEIGALDAEGQSFGDIHGQNLAVLSPAMYLKGLTFDGKLIVEDNGKVEENAKKSEFVAIIGESYHSVGLCLDGTARVICGGEKADDLRRQREIESWKDIVSIKGHYNYTAMLKDGTAKTTNTGNYQCLEKCQNVAEVLCDDLVALRDGTLVHNILGSERWVQKCRLKPQINTWDELLAYEKELWTVKRTTSPNVVNPSAGGCYIATCVYGSYDCPPVWTLRRYRDTVLQKNWFGRMFVRTYYAISPKLVKRFGASRWFTNMWKKRLDKMVTRLEKRGFENTPYRDE